MRQTPHIAAVPVEVPRDMKRPPVWTLVCLFLCILVVGPAASNRAGAGEPAAPEILSDTSALPAQVKRMREAILEAARSGDIEMLVPVLEMNELKPTVSFGDADDPVKYWKRTSGDGEGRQILAVLAEILEMPFARVNAGKPEEMYVWPYLAELPLDRLAPPQQVDLYRLVTPEDVKTMNEFGGYIHYRLGIGPDGTWHYFVAGD
jgi:hypothetical protein